MRKARVAPFVQTEPDDKTEDLKMYYKGKDVVEIEVPFQKNNRNIVKPFNMPYNQAELTTHAKNWNILINTVRFKANLVNFENFNRYSKKEIFSTTENTRCGVQHLCLLDEYNALNSKNIIQQNKENMGKENKNKNETLIKYFINLARKDNDQEKLVDFQHLSDMFQSGVNINTTDKHGQSVMHEVARIWHTDVAKFLLLHGSQYLL